MCLLIVNKRLFIYPVVHRQYILCCLKSEFFSLDENVCYSQGFGGGDHFFSCTAPAEHLKFPCSGSASILGKNPLLHLLYSLTLLILTRCPISSLKPFVNNTSVIFKSRFPNSTKRITPNISTTCIN